MAMMVVEPGTANNAILPGNYSAPSGVYDEFLTSDGQTRTNAIPFLQSLKSLSTEELTRRWQEAERWIYENGMAHGALDEGAPENRPWRLDPIPLIIQPEEWKTLSAGLIQRAQLLNQVLADLYGPQTLLARGLVPPEIINCHPAFLRPAHSVAVPNGRYLVLYAADLIRAPDGRWWITGDRTDAPFGAGYALENRLVVNRVLPGVFADCKVERLAPFFINLRETLRALAPQRRENPRIVLLTVGPKHPGYFEDAFLSRYLGYTLVEGGDLAVRSNRVMLKTLGGLLPVDVIFRRMTDQQCDPLELRGDSWMGVSGLLQAVRAGHVAVVNPLGSSLVESPSFLPYLPRLCQELTGIPLQLPALATWWCADPEAKKYVVDHHAELRLRPAFRERRRHGLSPDPRRVTSQEQWFNLLATRPELVAAQQKAELSSAPTWSPAGVRSARLTIRVYLVSNGDSYSVLPGGLVRFAENPQAFDGSILSGEGCKDTWVISDGPVKDVSLLPSSGQPVELRRTGAELPSRVADNLYWLGRQVERAEGAARLLRTTLARLSSESTATGAPELPALLRALAERGQIEPGFVVEGIRQQLPKIEIALPAGVLDEQQPGSLRSTVASMHRVASSVRDRLSIDSWRIISRMDQDFVPPARRSDNDLAGLLLKLNALLIDLSSFAGMVMESMTRTQGWRFLDIGRRLERSLHTIELVRSLALAPRANEAPALEALLETGDSVMTYRSRYMTQLQTAPVIDLMLTDETNPRSLAYQLVALAEHVDNLPRDRTQPLRSPEQRIALASLHAVRSLTLEDLQETARPNQRPKIDRVLEILAERLPRLSDVICHRYLIHAGAPRQMLEFYPSE